MRAWAATLGMWTCIVAGAALLGLAVFLFTGGVL
jgi:hypothetical protein